MLPVTCVLTRESTMEEHEVQICNTGALNCMTSPLWFNKTQAAALQSRVVCHFCLSGLLWIPRWPPTITSAATWLQGGPQERQDRREGMGGGGWSLSLHSTCGSRNDGGVHTQNRSDLMERRKWLMRSGSPLGDAGLPSSKGRRSSPPWATSPDPFTICAPWPSPFSFCVTPVMLTLTHATSRAQNLLLHFILKGGIKKRKSRDSIVNFKCGLTTEAPHTCDLSFVFVCNPAREFGPGSS